MADRNRPETLRGAAGIAWIASGLAASPVGWSIIRNLTGLDPSAIYQDRAGLLIALAITSILIGFVTLVRPTFGLSLTSIFWGLILAGIAVVSIGHPETPAAYLGAATLAGTAALLSYLDYRTLTAAD